MMKVKVDPAGAPVIALIGCGAITEALHLPALARHPALIAKAICVDPNLARAKAMAARFGAARAVQRYEEVLDDADGAVVAVPPKLHYPIALNILSAGIHVLCEKPLTETGQEACRLIARAKKMNVELCVNNYQRLYPSSIKVRDLIASGELGKVRRLEFSWGEQFDWPAASASYFGAAAGRGVLADKGAHLIDLICWWLGGKPRVVSYEDDSMGGTEAVADLRFRIDECEGTVQFSSLSKYRNTFEIEGERLTVTGGLYDWKTVTLKRSTGRAQRLELPTRAKVPQDLGQTVFDNFLDVVGGEGRPAVSGSDVLPSIELIDECYVRRQRRPMPWYDAWRRIAD
jgi:predicted dehydrogenase